jgi:predicted house-cleaning noncanonical NTP pyrophosphatase (MazG superfamily)
MIQHYGDSYRLKDVIFIAEIIFKQKVIFMTKTYNKLVRDRIPEIIEASGAECKTEILADEKYLEMIDAKLDEELAEYHKDQNIEELADLLEVIRAATIARGYTLEELEAVRAKKAEKRGGFEKKILLIETIEK